MEKSHGISALSHHQVYQCAFASVHLAITWSYLLGGQSSSSPLGANGSFSGLHSGTHWLVSYQPCKRGYRLLPVSECISGQKHGSLVRLHI